jgi:integrase
MGTNRSTRVKYLDPSQLTKLFVIARKHPLRDRVLLLCCFRFGLRISEALGIRTADINWEGRTITIEGRKGGAVATYSVPRELLSLIKRMEPSGAFLFDSREGEQLTRTPAYNAIKRMLVEAGLGDFTPHSLRHSLATEMLRAGCDLHHVKDALRHRSIRSSEIYAAVSPATRLAYTRIMDRGIVKAS